MGFFEILLLFLCFCVISTVMELCKLVIQGKIIKDQQTKRVDALFTSFIRSFMKYRLEIVKLFKEGEKND